MDNGSLLLLFLEVSVVSLAVKAIAILVAVILIGATIGTIAVIRKIKANKAAML